MTGIVGIELGDDGREIVITHLIFYQQHQGRHYIVIRIDDLNIAATNGLQTGLAGAAIKLNKGKHVRQIGDRYGGHLHLMQTLQQQFNRDQAIADGVFGV